MPIQQLRGSGSYAPLRVQRAFYELDDGRGSRAAALSEALGVVMNAAPAIAENEGRKAFQTGMEARIAGVKAENANAKNNSFLGFMFSDRAKDGFDYQDAQLAIPAIQSEELLALNELRESRNPEEFAAWLTQRDEKVRERLDGRSDMYTYTVAKALQDTRQDQARLFTGWVQNNRESDRRAAAEAAARVAAENRAMQIAEADTLAYDKLVSGDTNWFSSFVTEAGETYGIGAGDAKQLGLDTAIARADALNDPSILKEIDARFLNVEQRGKLANAIDQITGEQVSMQSIEAQATSAQADADARAHKQWIENSKSVLIGRVMADPALTATQVMAEARATGMYESAEIMDLGEMVGKIRNQIADPIMDTMNYQSWEDQVIRSGVNGGRPSQAELNTALLNATTKEGQQKVLDAYLTAEKIARDTVFTGSEPYMKDIQQNFPSGVGQDESLSSFIASQGTGSYFTPSADTDAVEVFNNTVYQLASDFYRANPESILGFAQRTEIFKQARDLTLERFKGIPTEDTVSTASDAASRLSAMN